MAEKRAQQAIDRIERALERIEAAVQRPQPRRDDRELQELRALHQALRGKVENAIEQIDRLIEADAR